jgi:hypothetical protein
MSIRQQMLFAQPKGAFLRVKEDHELVQMEKNIDWDVLMEIAMKCRKGHVKAETGPEPHYRELLGAVALMAVKGCTYRDAEDLIAHYAPARYLCNLMDATWEIDHVTIFQFIEMLGASGMSEVNKQVLKKAVEKGFADPKVLMSDTTAQESKISYPNEIGLMSKYMKTVYRLAGKAQGKFLKIRSGLKEKVKMVKGMVKNAHVFAKTKEAKQKIMKKLLIEVEKMHRKLKRKVQSGRKLRRKASVELKRLTEVMETLIPQMKFFANTGFVAAKKIIHLNMSKLYAIVRGKAGKRVEFGLKWGVNRIKGGYASGFLVDNGKHVSDKKFCIEAIKEHKRDFEEAPKIFGFDRGGYSEANIKKARKLEVKHVGIAPKGKKQWAVAEYMRKFVIGERAQVEGTIGTVKSRRYGFNKPDARSISTMIIRGHRAFLGANLTKLVRDLRKLQEQPA